MVICLHPRGAYLLKFIEGSAECFIHLAPCISCNACLCAPLTSLKPHRSIAFTGRNLAYERAGREALMSLPTSSPAVIDVIEWVIRRRHLAYRYPCRIARSRTAGKLTVRDSQAAIFVNEGKVADALARDSIR